jgi:hypothetical protein
VVFAVDVKIKKVTAWFFVYPCKTTTISLSPKSKKREEKHAHTLEK